MLTKITRFSLLALLLLAVAGCASYPYYGSDGVYYEKDYYDSYGYGYGYGYYDPYSIYPRSYYPYNYYYYRNSYYYNPYYPYRYYRFYDRDDNEREEHGDQNARDELRRITPDRSIRRSGISTDPPVIRRAEQERPAINVDRGSTRRALNRIDRSSPSRVRRPISRTPRSSVSRPDNSARSQLRRIEPPRQRR